MAFYLFDTNHVQSAWDRSNEVLNTRLRKVPPENSPRVCAITLGELQVGMELSPESDDTKRHAFQKFIVQDLLPYAIDITSGTRFEYSGIVARILKAYPKGPRTRTEFHLVEQGVDMNDVWLAAVALERNITVLSADRMLKIRECCPELRVENWLV